MNPRKRWCVKRRHYDGGESIVRLCYDRLEAELECAELNEAYQSNNYYIEEYAQ